MNSGKLETVNNTGSDTLSQDENVADSARWLNKQPPCQYLRQYASKWKQK